MHLLALRALKANGGVPVTVKVIVEGSEEQGTGGLERYAEAHPELLAADTIVIGDTGNFRLGLPTVTATLRGMTMLRVRIDTLEGNLHSGSFGGAAPDALAALIRVLDSLRAEDGSTTVDGLAADADWDGLVYEEADFRADAKVLDGVGLIGHGSVSDRIWARPAVTVLGIDCPPVVGATPSIQASARATVSLRVPPGQDAAEATKLLTAHIEKHTPWGRGCRRNTSARVSRSARTRRARRTRRWRTRCGSRTRDRTCRRPVRAVPFRSATPWPRCIRRRRSC